MTLTVTVIGAGGIGTVLAGALHDTGHRVVVCARTPRRLSLDQDGRSTELDVAVVTDPESVSASDWVLLCTKARDTEGAAPWLLQACGRETTVMVCQNGIDHVDRVKHLIGPATAVPTLVYIAAERTEDGHVRHNRGRRIVVPSGRIGDRVVALAPRGVEVTVEDDFRTAAWRKLLTNVAANGITALTGHRMGILREPPVRDLAAALLDETVQVGCAEGALLGPADVAATLDFYDAFDPLDGTSMLYDRLAGRPTEYEFFNGAVVALGDKHGIPTPANRIVYTLLHATEPQTRVDL